MTNVNLEPKQDLLAASQRVLQNLETNLLDIEPGGTFEVLDPATAQPIADVPDFSPEAALSALGQADEAGKAWKQTTPRHRADLLQNVYNTLIEHKDDLALLIAREMGKPLAEAYGEVQYGADYVLWYAQQAVRSAGNYRQNPLGGSTILTTRVPIGLSLAITPWNFPLAMATRKIAPALAAGCPILIKPAALTPLTTIKVVSLMYEAGIPRDLVRVVTTSSSSKFSKAVMADERLRKVSFTGSTGVGATLLEQAAANILKSSMELGGNAPLLVFDEADIDQAVTGALTAKLRNGGQSCVAANRILVQESVAEEFTEKFAEKIAQTVVGNALGEGVQLGPVIEQSALDKQIQLIEEAVELGGRLVTGGSKVAGDGYFLEPTVVADIPPESEMAQTEIFGPIAAVSTFKDEAEAIAQANSTPFGLAGYIFTQNVEQVLRVSENLDVGMVGVNLGVTSNVAAPFGGIKQSGLGREGSEEGLEEYQEIKFLNIAN